MAGTVEISTVQELSPSYVNSFRISAVISRLLVHLRRDANSESTEFFNLCLSLARGIDYAVANNEKPGRASELPSLIKQVCQKKTEPQLQAAVMVLMISVKSACSGGWFSEKEKEEVLVLSEEMQTTFCSVNVKEMNSNMKNKETSLLPTISTIMSRFYPGMKMGEILCLVEATPGYDSYVTDLHITKSARSNTDDKIYLFVAQTDNIETSSCIISPQQVNFLLNGEGVERRTCVYRDPGPQAPTPVTHMLKYGSNLLQVVGQFHGKYIIVIAFMSLVSISCPSLQDYTPPASAAPDSDNEIIEGPSRISLKCPISFSRIKTPVKGHTCKHLQCFDFNNYVGINSRRPQWRCPHCSQSVSFHDIRIDQSMVKVLKEVGEDITYVKFSGDGKWEPTTENNEHTEKPNENLPPVHQECTINNVDDIMDLTEGDNETDTRDKDFEKKPTSNDMNNVQRNTAPHMEDGFWREFYSSLPTRTSDVASLGRETSFQRNHNLVLNSMSQNQSQSQSQSQNENPNNIGNGYSRYPTHVLNVSRAGNAVQALPVQTSADRQHLQNLARHLNQHMSSQGQISGGRHTSPLPPDRFRSHPPHQQPSFNQRTPFPTRPSPPPPQQPPRQGGGGVPNSQPHFSLADIHRAAHNMRAPTPAPTPTSTPIQTSGSLSSIPVTLPGEQRDPVDPSADQNWRPTGRMRGSLSGRAYSEALNQFIIHPNQPVQAARPPVLNTPRPFIPPHFQALMANNMRTQTQTQTPDSDANMAGGIFPDK